MFKTYFYLDDEILYFKYEDLLKKFSSKRVKYIAIDYSICYLKIDLSEEELNDLF